MNQNEKFPILVSTISTLVITLLEIAYSLTCGILFVYYIEKKSYTNQNFQFQNKNQHLLLPLASYLRHMSLMI